LVVLVVKASLVVAALIHLRASAIGLSEWIAGPPLYTGDPEPFMSW
jgi:hypothetical protein